LRKAVDSDRDDRKTVHHDIGHLCGIWNEHEGAEFEKHLIEQRRIDENLLYFQGNHAKIILLTDFCLRIA
jgi:hypothetical protein